MLASKQHGFKLTQILHGRDFTWDHSGQGIEMESQILCKGKANRVGELGITEPTTNISVSLANELVAQRQTTHRALLARRSQLGLFP
jgi:hypothetical protein